MAAVSPYSWGAEADIRVLVTIDESGRVESATLSKPAAGVPAEVALEDVRSWQFKPATRNGVPIAVEGFLEIPFRQVTGGEPKR